MAPSSLPVPHQAGKGGPYPAVRTQLQLLQEAPSHQHPLLQTAQLVPVSVQADSTDESQIGSDQNCFRSLGHRDNATGNQGIASNLLCQQRMPATHNSSSITVKSSNSNRSSRARQTPLMSRVYLQNSILEGTNSSGSSQEINSSHSSRSSSGREGSGAREDLGSRHLLSA